MNTVYQDLGLKSLYKSWVSCCDMLHAGTDLKQNMFLLPVSLPAA